MRSTELRCVTVTLLAKVLDGIDGTLKPGMDVPLTIHRRDGTSETVTLTCRIDTAEEVEYFKNGGVLHYVLRNLAHAA